MTLVIRLNFLLLLTLCAVSALAQSDDDAAAIRREHWMAGVLVSGGSGLIDRTNVQFIRAGLRVGRVLTGELGKGVGRGTFELDAEIAPVDYVLWRGYGDVYGFSVSPVVMKWNFTGFGHKTIPYFLAAGGMLHTRVKIPPGNTSTVNFVTGPGIGFNHFLKPGRSLNVDVRATHLSNGSLGDHNPGVNASLQLSVGYNWWKQ
jgi:lipid A 3-O-deacylase